MFSYKYSKSFCFYSKTQSVNVQNNEKCPTTERVNITTDRVHCNETLLEKASMHDYEYPAAVLQMYMYSDYDSVTLSADVVILDSKGVGLHLDGDTLNSYDFRSNFIMNNCSTV